MLKYSITLEVLKGCFVFCQETAGSNRGETSDFASPHRAYFVSKIRNMRITNTRYTHFVPIQKAGCPRPPADKIGTCMQSPASAAAADCCSRKTRACEGIYPPLMPCLRWPFVAIRVTGRPHRSRRGCNVLASSGAALLSHFVLLARSLVPSSTTTTTTTTTAASIHLIAVDIECAPAAKSAFSVTRAGPVLRSVLVRPSSINRLSHNTACHRQLPFPSIPFPSLPSLPSSAVAGNSPGRSSSSCFITTVLGRQRGPSAV